MLTDEFDYTLPPELIAQAPSARRDGSRLLVVGDVEMDYEDCRFSDFPRFFDAGDLLIVNDTRVVPARLQCQKESGGRVEVMLERMLADGEFLALARSNKPLRPGQVLSIDNRSELEFIQREGEFFRFRMLAAESEEPFDIFHRLGDMPLPPYIKRAPEKQDAERYQTVYAETEGAVAAPTAGLHFNQDILDELVRKGVEFARVTLHVGAGTFQPVKVERIDEHRMHEEWIEVSEEVVAKVAQCRAAGRRIVAVGTTTVRALESAAQSGELMAYRGPTDIFIYPGYDFKVVDVLLSNFHLPRSTLLMMVSAFAGRSQIKAAYEHAVDYRYRFFSYGDAMLLNKRSVS